MTVRSSIIALCAWGMFFAGTEKDKGKTNSHDRNSAKSATHTSMAVDPTILKQVDSLKAKFAAEGFTLLKEAPLNMESQFEFPIMVPLNEKTWYHFVFIGEMSSNLYEVRVFDYDEKQVIYQKKRWGDIDGNIISFSYIPKFSELHLFKPIQNNKKKQVSGYVMLLKKTN
jgi:hypothetical protein